MLTHSWRQRLTLKKYIVYGCFFLLTNTLVYNQIPAANDVPVSLSIIFCLLLFEVLTSLNITQCNMRILQLTYCRLLLLSHTVYTAGSHFEVGYAIRSALLIL